jgi:protoporphyrinogen oxidase
MKNSQKKVLIVGAGPAGLTAGFELLNRGFQVTILEADKTFVGGISRTVEYKGYRFDIGGHRFFSKNQEVMKWWEDMLKDDFLKRPRLSRWYYRKKFFQYPIKLMEMLWVFGPIDSARIFVSYLKFKFFPIKPEVSLADWCINNFGYFLAKPFFLDYNYKLWGVTADKLSKDFSAQRIKGISFFNTIKDALMTMFKIKGEKVSKSLIDEFNYPKLGPGMMWEKVAKVIRQKGGQIVMDRKVEKIIHSDGKISKVITKNSQGSQAEYSGYDYVLTTMPLKEVVLSMDPIVPQEVIDAANNLTFRDFITVAIMLNKKDLPPDDWVYTHDEGLRSIRIQIFKNWSPFMVPDQDKSCVGFEFVANEGDELWNMSDEELINIAKTDIEKLGFAKSTDVFDAKVVKLKNVYPTYLIGYQDKVDTIKDYLQKTFKGYALQPIGRGGQHRYNNSDHSMMTAILAVRNIAGEGKYDPWEVNSEAEYHEEK